MTQAPRSGSGRNNPRGGQRKAGGSGAPSGGRGAPKGAGSRAAGGRSHGAPAAGRSTSWPAKGTGTPGAGSAGNAAGKATGKTSGKTFGQASGKPVAKAAGKAAGKPAGKGKGTPQQQAGPRPFGSERFGRNLGPVRRRPSRPRTAPIQSEVHDPDGVRLQKVLASAGVASRRVCEELIEAGRVEVDGQVVRELGVRVDPQRAVIHVDGIRIQLDETLVYYVFNKPKGVVSTMEDPEGRPCISDFLKNKGERLFHVGRLDVATEGLLLLTNDGELANRLTHPSYEIPKTYLVQVRGPLPHGVGTQMREGIELEDGTASVDSFRLVDSTPGHVLVEVVLHSGKNRIVRRLFDAVGHPVERLVRVKIGPIALGDQRQGSVRALGRHEVGHLLAAVGM